MKNKRTNALKGVARSRYKAFSGVAVRDKRVPEGHGKVPACDLIYKHESVTLARLAALGI